MMTTEEMFSKMEILFLYLIDDIESEDMEKSIFGKYDMFDGQ